MAETDWPPVAPVVSEPERKLASVFGADHGQRAAPIDVDTVARKFADVEHIYIPANTDGLLLRKAGKRPRILISTRLSAGSPRYRFTLAHELGHLIIPWQLGDTFCHTDENGRLKVTNDSLGETEANKFASELLVPTSWLIERYAERSGNLARYVVQLARMAQVSVAVIVFSIRRIARPGSLFIFHDNRVIESADASPKTPADSPQKGAAIAPLFRRWIESGCAVYNENIGQDAYLTSVEFPLTTALPTIDESITSAQLLDQLIAQLNLDAAARQSLLGKINGSISAVNIVEHYKDSEEKMFAGLVQKFAEREHIGPTIRHPRFKEFLALKARELTSPKAPPKRRNRRPEK